MSIVKSPFPRLQRSHPLARGLVAAYTFSEGSGNVLHDVSGSGNDGTLTNGPTWGGGCAGYALNFASASSQYAQMPKAPVTAFPLGVICRFNPTSQKAFITSNSSGTTNNGWRLALNSPSGTLLFVLGGIANIDSLIAVSLNVWSLIAVSVDRNQGTAKFSINGKRGNSPLGGSSMSGTPGQFWIGRDMFSNYFDGQIDFVLIYNRTFDDNDFDLAQAEYGV